MNKIAFVYQEDKFQRYLMIALGAHFAILFTIFILQYVLDIDWFKREELEKKRELIQSSVRVDVVAMPKFTVQELKKMKVAPPSSDTQDQKAAPVKDQSSSDVEFKQKSKKVDLENILNNLSKKQGKRKKSKTKGIDKPKLDNTQLRKLVLEGNKVSKGTSVVGDGLAQEKTLFNQYVATLPNFVRPYWKLPSYLLDRNLNARVRVYIGSSGKILRMEIFESSGVDEFDRKALNSLKKVNRFPAPAREIRIKVSSGDVILGFPL